MANPFFCKCILIILQCTSISSSQFRVVSYESSWGRWRILFQQLTKGTFVHIGVNKLNICFMSGSHWRVCRNIPFSANWCSTLWIPCRICSITSEALLRPICLLIVVSAKVGIFGLRKMCIVLSHDVLYHFCRRSNTLPCLDGVSRFCCLIRGACNSQGRLVLLVISSVSEFIWT